jgi:hypothetical protein
VVRVVGSCGLVKGRVGYGQVDDGFSRIVVDSAIANDRPTSISGLSNPHNSRLRCGKGGQSADRVPVQNGRNITTRELLLMSDEYKDPPRSSTSICQLRPYQDQILFVPLISFHSPTPDLEEKLNFRPWFFLDVFAARCWASITRAV